MDLTDEYVKVNGRLRHVPGKFKTIDEVLAYLREEWNANLDTYLVNQIQAFVDEYMSDTLVKNIRADFARISST